MIADDRGSQIAKCSAIVCDHMETSLKIQSSTDKYVRRLLSASQYCRVRGNQIVEHSLFAIICDQLRSCDHMETKVLRSAIETYPIIF